MSEDNDIKELENTYETIVSNPEPELPKKKGWFHREHKQQHPPKKPEHIVPVISFPEKNETSDPQPKPTKVQDVYIPPSWGQSINSDDEPEKELRKAKFLTVGLHEKPKITTEHIHTPMVFTVTVCKDCGNVVEVKKGK